MIGYSAYTDETVDPNSNIYVWDDGTTEKDYEAWGTDLPSSSKLQCVTWGVDAGMRDWACESHTRAGICEKELIICEYYVLYHLKDS